MDLDDALPMLQRLAAWDRALPPAPWRAEEHSHLQVHGPAEFDPDIDVDRVPFDRQEQARADRAAWRGLVSADGQRVVGEPLAGGSVRDVTDSTWRALADLRSDLPAVLALLRRLWPRAAETPETPTSAPDTQPSAPPPRASPDAALLERIAAAAYQSDGAPVPFSSLPATVQAEWRSRAVAVLKEIEGSV
jgi:hypothetical protein